MGPTTIDELRGRRVLVAGLGASGRSAVDVLTEIGADVVAADADPTVADRVELPPQVALVADPHPDRLAERALLTEPDLVVTSPGWNPRTPLLARARAEVISEVELAWRIAPPGIRWLTLTGTNGKTTTVGMLASILAAHGWQAPAVGNVGTPIAATVLAARSAERPLDALAVELSSFQLHYTRTLVPLAAACLNVDADHLDWHGSMNAYVAAKARIYARTRVACVYNTADPCTRQMVEQADVTEGARAVGFTLGTPAVGEVGMVEDVLADRAFVPHRASHAAELGTLADLAHLAEAGGGAAGPDGRDRPSVPRHVVANALAAAALARAAGVGPADVAAGLRTYTTGPHRMQTVAEIDGVRYIDDSKATNAHAAAAALAAMPEGGAVWIAGGLAKGAQFDELVATFASKLRAAVVIGTDPEPITSALSRHAPDVPRLVVPAGDTEVMTTAVTRAAGLARPGDVVLLAPACASMDQFVSYADRGEQFATAVRQVRP
ncbi:UDP-N-acetylmuramoyl-L-alanine--D-glutamate ligase [Ruania albidiflava]|uniref:UDP-N-acetylmuramoyl-L-alanine--D-glutamate ligase n=1 Tax=Ruania albidiflava TaxID=366586 RepID=UPI0003B5FC8E|nr:UDP-N-acetylmuramoyl-L-alanine--D-glutamate ligase [Ruania albidiflava]